VPDTRLTDSRLQELETQVQELQIQNRQLQQLLNYQQKMPLATVATTVVGRSAGHWWHQIWVGEGSAKVLSPRIRTFFKPSLRASLPKSSIQIPLNAAFLEGFFAQIVNTNPLKCFNQGAEKYLG